MTQRQGWRRAALEDLALLGADVGLDWTLIDIQVLERPPHMPRMTSGLVWWALSVEAGAALIRPRSSGRAVLRRNDRIYVEGRLKLSEWTGRDGEKRTGLSVAAWKAERLGRLALSRIYAHVREEKRWQGSRSTPRSRPRRDIGRRWARLKQMGTTAGALSHEVSRSG